MSMAITPATARAVTSAPVDASCAARSTACTLSGTLATVLSAMVVPVVPPVLSTAPITVDPPCAPLAVPAVPVEPLVAPSCFCPSSNAANAAFAAVTSRSRCDTASPASRYASCAALSAALA